MKTENDKMIFSSIPIDSSLGHLAYGHVAFLAWRKVKKQIGTGDEEK